MRFDIISPVDISFFGESLVAVFGVDVPLELELCSLLGCSSDADIESLCFSRKAILILISFVNKIGSFDTPGPRADRIGRISFTKTPLI